MAMSKPRTRYRNSTGIGTGTRPKARLDFTADTKNVLGLKSSEVFPQTSKPRPSPAPTPPPALGGHGGAPPVHGMVPRANRVVRPGMGAGKGTDTVPAMLTPHEAVATRNGAELLGRDRIAEANAIGNKLAARGIDLAGGGSTGTKPSPGGGPELFGDSVKFFRGSQAQNSNSRKALGTGGLDGKQFTPKPKVKSGGSKIRGYQTGAEEVARTGPDDIEREGYKSIGLSINGIETEVPALIPGLTPEEEAVVKSELPVTNWPKNVLEKIENHARDRLEQGLPVFQNSQPNLLTDPTTGHTAYEVPSGVRPDMGTGPGQIEQDYLERLGSGKIDELPGWLKEELGRGDRETLTPEDMDRRYKAKQAAGERRRKVVMNEMPDQQFQQGTDDVMPGAVTGWMRKFLRLDDKTPAYDEKDLNRRVSIPDPRDSGARRGEYLSEEGVKMEREAARVRARAERAATGVNVYEKGSDDVGIDQGNYKKRVVGGGAASALTRQLWDKYYGPPGAHVLAPDLTREGPLSEPMMAQGGTENVTDPGDPDWLRLRQPQARDLVYRTQHQEPPPSEWELAKESLMRMLNPLTAGKELYDIFTRSHERRMGQSDIMPERYQKGKGFGSGAGQPPIYPEGEVEMPDPEDLPVNPVPPEPPPKGEKKKEELLSLAGGSSDVNPGTIGYVDPKNVDPAWQDVQLEAPRLDLSKLQENAKKKGMSADAVKNLLTAAQGLGFLGGSTPTYGEGSNVSQALGPTLEAATQGMGYRKGTSNVNLKHFQRGTANVPVVQGGPDPMQRQRPDPRGAPTPFDRPGPDIGAQILAGPAGTAHAQQAGGYGQAIGGGGSPIGGYGGYGGVLGAGGQPIGAGGTPYGGGGQPYGGGGGGSYGAGGLPVGGGFGGYGGLYGGGQPFGGGGVTYGGGSPYPIGVGSGGDPYGAMMPPQLRGQPEEDPFRGVGMLRRTMYGRGGAGRGRDQFGFAGGTADVPDSTRYPQPYPPGVGADGLEYHGDAGGWYGPTNETEDDYTQFNTPLNYNRGAPYEGVNFLRLSRGSANVPFLF